MKPITLTLFSIFLTLTSFTQTLQNGGQAQPLEESVAQNRGVSLPESMAGVAEPQFKFWLAFEDSIGAKDTLWVIIDTAAKSNNSLPPDTLLGEIPLGIVDSNKFLVYYKITDNDSFKINATNTNFKEVSFNIQAQNYQLPITIRWDSSLLRNNGLPWDGVYGYLINDFISFNINFSPYGFAGFDKFNSIELLPFQQGGGMGSHFPLGLKITEEDIYQVGLDNNKINNSFKVYPNPTPKHIRIVSDDQIAYEVFNFMGQLLFSGTNEFIDLSQFLTPTPQTIFFKIKTINNEIYIKKVLFMP